MERIYFWNGTDRFFGTVRFLERNGTARNGTALVYAARSEGYKVDRSEGYMPIGVRDIC